MQCPNSINKCNIQCNSGSCQAVYISNGLGANINIDAAHVAWGLEEEISIINASLASSLNINGHEENAFMYASVICPQYQYKSCHLWTYKGDFSELKISSQTGFKALICVVPIIQIHTDA